MSDWWHEKSLFELNRREWEALCDGCGRCCLHKIEEIDTQELLYTRVACQQFDIERCRCSNYAKRRQLVPDCVDLSTLDIHELEQLPTTCAYRLRAGGQPLPQWHPLITGDPESVHAAGISIRGNAISDEYVHPDGYDEHILFWMS